MYQYFPWLSLVFVCVWWRVLCPPHDFFSAVWTMVPEDPVGRHVGLSQNEATQKKLSALEWKNPIEKMDGIPGITPMSLKKCIDHLNSAHNGCHKHVQSPQKKGSKDSTSILYIYIFNYTYIYLTIQPYLTIFYYSWYRNGIGNILLFHILPFWGEIDHEKTWTYYIYI